MKIDIPVADKKATPTLLVHLTESDLIGIIRQELNAILRSIFLQSQPPILEPEPELMTRTKVRELFGVSLPTLIRWAKDNTLPCLHINRCVRYRVSDVKKALKLKKGSSL